MRVLGFVHAMTNVAVLVYFVVMIAFFIALLVGHIRNK